MKEQIADETKEITNERIKREIKNNIELIEDLLIMANDLTDDYTKHRLHKAIKNINKFNDKIK